MLWNMADHGAIFAHFVDDKPYYRIAPFIPGVYEYLMDYRTMDKEMAELFVEATAEMAWLVRNISPIDGGLMKIVPVRQEVVAQPKVLSHEDVMTFVDAPKCIRWPIARAVMRRSCSGKAASIRWKASASSSDRTLSSTKQPAAAVGSTGTSASRS